jgi:hypothetical protein
LLVDTSGLSDSAGDAGVDGTMDDAAVGVADGTASADADASPDSEAGTIIVLTSATNVVRFNNNTAELPASEVTAGLGQNAVVKQTGIRFPDVPIAKGTPIISARLRLVAKETQSGNATNLAFTFGASDTAAPWGTVFADYAAVPRGTKVSWPSVDTWLAGATYDSPELAGALQSVIDRPGWVSGNALALFFAEDGSAGANQQRVAFAPNGGATDPVLVVRLH